MHVPISGNVYNEVIDFEKCRLRFYFDNGFYLVKSTYIDFLTKSRYSPSYLS